MRLDCKSVIELRTFIQIAVLNGIYTKEKKEDDTTC